MPRRWPRHSATTWSRAWIRPRRRIGARKRRRTDPPALPQGCTPLDRFVSGPAALGRRLAQIGVAEPAVAAALQGRLLQGQRLVSKDGGLWRWDGFVRLPDAAGPGATRLRQRARLRRLEAERAQQEAVLATGQVELAAAEEAAGGARATLEQADDARRAASVALETARDAATQARAADAGLAAELAALADEMDRVEQELSELASGPGDGPVPQALSAEQAKAARGEAPCRRRRRP